MNPTRIYLLGVYVALWAIALTAPAADPGRLLLDLFTFRGPDAVSIAVFNLMGVWPILFAAPLLFDGPEQRLPAWPFVVLSFGAGAFVLGPYLLMRRWGRPARPPNRWLRVVTHPWLAMVAALATVGLIGYAAAFGSVSVFIERLASNGFVRTFTADFVAFCLMYPAVALDDRRRAGMRSGAWTVFVPLLGAAWHMGRRPTSRSAA